MTVHQAPVGPEQPKSNGERKHDVPKDVMIEIEGVLRRVWTTTGFGQICVESARIKGGLIQVIIHAGVCQRFIISGTDAHDM